jgi:hypothetical protein
LQDIGLFAVTESQCTEDEHDDDDEDEHDDDDEDEDDSKFRNSVKNSRIQRPEESSIMYNPRTESSIAAFLNS